MTIQAWITVIVLATGIVFHAGILWNIALTNRKKIEENERRTNNCITTIMSDIAEINESLAFLKGKIDRKIK